MAKRRSSVRKREREIEKRQRELRKSQRAATKRERRLNRDRQVSSVPSEGGDVAANQDETGRCDGTNSKEPSIEERRASC